MSDAEEPDVGCGQVQSVRTLGIGVEARADDGEGGTTIVWGDNVDLAWVPRVLGQDARRLSLCLHRKGEVSELDLRWPSECRVYINHDESWVVSGGVARWVKNMVSGTLFV